MRKLDDNNIDKLFREKMEGAEMKPPSFVLENLEATTIPKLTAVSNTAKVVKMVSALAIAASVTVIGVIYYDTPDETADITIETPSINNDKKQNADDKNFTLEDSENKSTNETTDAQIAASDVDEDKNETPANEMVADDKSGAEEKSTPSNQAPAPPSEENLATNAPGTNDVTSQPKVDRKDLNAPKKTEADKGNPGIAPKTEANPKKTKEGGQPKEMTPSPGSDLANDGNKANTDGSADAPAETPASNGADLANRNTNPDATNANNASNDQLANNPNEAGSSNAQANQASGGYGANNGSSIANSNGDGTGISNNGTGGGSVNYDHDSDGSDYTPKDLADRPENDVEVDRNSNNASVDGGNVDKSSDDWSVENTDREHLEMMKITGNMIEDGPTSLPEDNRKKLSPLKLDFNLPVSFELMGGIATPMNSLIVDTDYSRDMQAGAGRYQVYGSSITNYGLGVNVGISEKLEIGIGASMQQFSQVNEIDFQVLHEADPIYDDEYDDQDMDEDEDDYIIGYMDMYMIEGASPVELDDMEDFITIHGTTGRFNLGFDDIQQNLVETEYDLFSYDVSYEERISYLSIPLDVRYYLSKDVLSLYVQPSVSFNMLTEAVADVTIDNGHFLKYVQVELEGLQDYWSAGIGVGASYTLTEHWYLNGYAQYNSGLTPATDDVLIVNTWKNLGLRVGVGFKL